MARPAVCGNQSYGEGYKIACLQPFLGYFSSRGRGGVRQPDLRPWCCNRGDSSFGLLINGQKYNTPLLSVCLRRKIKTFCGPPHRCGLAGCSRSGSRWGREHGQVHLRVAVKWSAYWTLDTGDGGRGVRLFSRAIALLTEAQFRSGQEGKREKGNTQVDAPFHRVLLNWLF